MNRKQKAAEIFKRLVLVIRNPKSELNFENKFQLLVAVMLSAQTTDERVNMVTPALFAAAGDPESMSRLTPEKIFEYIKTVGLAGSKSKNLAAASAIIHEKYNDTVPDTFDELIALPGVGSKTARVVLNVGFNQPVIAVDTHIRRVSKRLGLTDSNDPDRISSDLTEIVPEEYLLHAHHYLLLHGRYTCQARKPRCSECRLSDLCRSADKTC